MEKQTSFWLEIIVPIFIALLSLIFNFIITNNMISTYKGKITIYDSIAVDHGYITTLGINNFTMYEYINNIQIDISDSIEINDIDSNKNIEVIKNGNIITINNVLPKCGQTLLLYTEDSIASNDIYIIANSNSILVTNAKNEAIANVVINIGVFVESFIIFLVIYFSIKSIKKASYELIEKKIFDGVKKNEENNQIVKSRYENQKREKYELRKYYISRINDFEKELNFWRNTVRQLLYKAGLKKIDVNDLQNEITNSLKTYGTKEKNYDTYEEIRFLTDKLKDDNK
ncbi:MAG: yddM [Clostridia bacterium]|jgi:hypothetical protein|nr:yddM [Clostridia bacterium]